MLIYEGAVTKVRRVQGSKAIDKTDEATGVVTTVQRPYDFTVVKLESGRDSWDELEATIGDEYGTPPAAGDVIRAEVEVFVRRRDGQTRLAVRVVRPVDAKPSRAA